MTVEELTKEEQRILASLPQPPHEGGVHTTNVWIVEWLGDGQRRTGQELHEWMRQARPGWSKYVRCFSKEDVLREIDHCSELANRGGFRPVLHIETHGGVAGIGPDATAAGLTWDELTEPLQRLNAATGCNLLVFVAACTGIAAIKTFVRGPRAPAVALVGPDADLDPRDIFEGAKEFYRRFIRPEGRLDNLVEGASRESTRASFEAQPFIDIAYEAFTGMIMVEARPEQQQERRAEHIKRLVSSGLSQEEARRRVDALPLFLANELQHQWDQMFLIDKIRENKTRFGLDVKALVGAVLAGIESRGAVQTADTAGERI